MTTLMTAEPTTRDPDTRWPAYALIAGGVLWSIGNGLHPLEHSEAAERAATWVAAHLTFTAGSVLLAVGLPVVTALWRGDRRWATAGQPVVARGWAARVSALSGALMFLGFAVTVPIGSYHEVFVATELAHHDQARIEAAALPVTGPLAAALLLGWLLLAICALAEPRPGLGRVSGALLLLAVFAMAAAEGLPGPEGLWIIPGTIVVGIALASAGFRSLRRPATR
ncbi:hypothetical protein [Nocardia sp. IFM 10818]